MAEVTERDRKAALSIAANEEIYLEIYREADPVVLTAYLAAYRESCVAEERAARERLVAERDACREDRNQLEAERGDWTNIRCDACGGFGENDNAMPCAKCSGEGRLWLTWKQQFDLSEAARLKAEGERDDEERSAAMHADLNRRAAKALGKPFEGEGSSWHDIPECIEALQARLRAVIEAADQLIKGGGMLANPLWFALLIEAISSLADAAAAYRKVRDAQPPASPEPEASPRHEVFQQQVKTLREIGASERVVAVAEQAAKEASPRVGHEFKHGFCARDGHYCAICGLPWSQHQEGR